MPNIFGQTPLMQDGGIKLLEDIKKSRHYSYPKYVISLSGYKESTDIFKQYQGNIHTSIDYDVTTNAWEEKLKGCIEAAIAVVTNTVLLRKYDYDIGVICALKEEIDFISDALENVNKIQVNYDDDIYMTGYFEKDDKKIRVVFHMQIRWEWWRLHL